MPDNRLPTNQSQLDIVNKLDEIKDAIAQGGGGGGGTGGHTIIDENGTSMTARAGLQFVGGANVEDDATNNKTIVDLASAGGIDGVFIDTGNVIFSETINDGSIAHSTYSYTATEDCIASILANGNSGGNVTGLLNGTAEVFRIVSTANFVKSLIPMKKGQTLTFTGLQAYAYFGVYGIQTGTTHSKFQPVIYSTEEREIGCWTDGKPLYQKTFVYANIPSLTNGMTFQTDLSNIDNSQISGFISEGATTYNFPYVGNNKGMGFVFSNSSNEFAARGNDSFSNANLVIHIQYTKTTDVAGSGNWTPQGVPTHHYSTDEQVIGTWVDGKTLYEKTYTGLNVAVAYNSWTNVVEVASDIDVLVDVKILASTTEKHNITGSGIEYYLDKNTHYIRAEYNQNVNKRNIGTITIQYTKSS